jgi:HEAT repeat protein
MPPAPTEVGGRSLESWMKDLKHPDASKRATAILNIIAFRENAAPAVPALLSHFRDPDASPRVKAVMAFRYLPESSFGDTSVGDVVKALSDVLTNDSQTIVRYETAVTLGRFAGKNRKAIPALVQGATRDRGTWEIRNACVEALRGAGFDPKKGPDREATRALVQALRDSTHEVRVNAMRNLGFMGPPADPALREEVIGALDAWARSRTADRTSVLWANVSLVFLGDELNDRALDAIARYLTARERDVRIQGIHALGVLGKKAKSKVPDLVNLLSDSEDTVVIAAAQALTVMSDSSERVLSRLIDLTRDKKDRAAVVYQACMSLSRIGGNKREVVKAMEDVSNRDSLPKELRSAVDAVLKDIKSKNEDRPRRPDLDRPVGRQER